MQIDFAAECGDRSFLMVNDASEVLYLFPQARLALPAIVALPDSRRLGHWTCTAMWTGKRDLRVDDFAGLRRQKGEHERVIDPVEVARLAAVVGERRADAASPLASGNRWRKSTTKVSPARRAGSGHLLFERVGPRRYPYRSCRGCRIREC